MARKFNFERSVTADDLMTPAEVRSADQILARLIAEAYAADHPELFGDRHSGERIIIAPSSEITAPSLWGSQNQEIMTAGETNARID